MNDITKHYRFQRILVEAAQYRCLRQVFKADAEVNSQTAAIMRNILAADRDDFAFVTEEAVHT
jgi:hypothetical protein